jgi:GNAT superfamily N-acetyltransferase
VTAHAGRAGEVEIRRARSGDAPQIGAYHHRCWIEGYAGLVDQATLDGLRVEDQVARWTRALREEPDVPVFVAVAGGVPVGHVRVEADTITNVYVHPRHWGGGIGRTLLGVGEDLLRTTGHDVGVLWTIVGNERAIALYTSAGWASDGTTEVHTSSAGVPIEELRMTKHLVGEHPLGRASRLE